MSGPLLAYLSGAWGAWFLSASVVWALRGGPHVQYTMGRAAIGTALLALFWPVAPIFLYLKIRRGVEAESRRRALLESAVQEWIEQQGDLVDDRSPDQSDRPLN